MEQLAIIRSMSTKEGDHTRATYFLRTGYLPNGPIQYPALGAALGKEMGVEAAELPNFVSIGPQTVLSPAGLFGRLPGIALCSAGRRLAGSSRSEGRKPGAGRRRETRRNSTPGWRCCKSSKSEFIDQHPDGTAAQPSVGLRPGGQHDAFDGGRRVQSGAASRRRCATPTAATSSAKAACWPGGWSKRECRSSKSRCRARARTAADWAGTRTKTISTRSKASAKCSIRPGAP